MVLQISSGDYDTNSSAPFFPALLWRNTGTDADVSINEIASNMDLRFKHTFGEFTSRLFSFHKNLLVGSNMNRRIEFLFMRYFLHSSLLYIITSTQINTFSFKLRESGHFFNILFSMMKL